MKVKIKKSYILIIAPRFVRFVGRLDTGTSKARAIAIFPFIITTPEDAETEWVINHERIHLKQQMETLFIGFLIISFIEEQYAKWILKKTKFERYVYTAAEQEAYRNQHNKDYLKDRKFGSLFYYVFHKKEFTLGKPGEIVYLDK